MGAAESSTRNGRRDYFELFRLEPDFDIDGDRLDRHFRALQQQFHPDRSAGAPAAEQRVAAQLSADINAGYQTLKDPVTRAGYLLERCGIDLKALQREPVSGDFLLRQMELRESLAELGGGDHPAREQLASQANELFNEGTEAFRAALASDNLDAAGMAWVHLLYLNKLRQEVTRSERA